MEGKVLIAIDDPRAQKELAELLREPAGIEVVSTFSGLDVLRKVKDLEPRLILLDVSLPGVSGYELCQMIKDSEYGRTPVILLSVHDEPLDERRVRLSRADSRLVLPLVDPGTARHTLLRYFSQMDAVRGGGFIADETRVALDLMTHRTAAILYAELGQIFVSEESRDFQRIERDEDQMRRIPAYFEDLMKDPTFTLKLARRLLDELPGLIWTEVAERLIEGTTCKLNDFGGFRKGSIGGQLGVEFIADNVLSEKKLPRMDYVARSDTLAAIQASRNELVPFLMQLADSDSKSEELLSQALPKVLNRFESQSEVIALDAAAGERRVESGRRRDWLSFRARAITHATFYTYLVDRARALHADKLFEVETVGTFRLERGNVGFRASPDFISLLLANPTALSAHR